MTFNRWIIEQVDQRKNNVDSITIREKARRLYEHLAQTEPSASTDSGTFNASHGWFHRFQHRFSLHNIARTGKIIQYLFILIIFIYLLYYKLAIFPLRRGASH